MGATLESGHFLGKVLRARHQGGLRLVDILYTAGAPRHAHERPYFCLIRRGRYTERWGRGTRDCRPLTVAYHPPGIQHAITLGATTVRAMNVELGPDWLGWMLDQNIPTDQPVDCHGGAGGQAALQLFHVLETEGDHLTLDALTAEVIASLCRPGPVVERRRPAWLEGVRDQLDGESGGRSSLRDLAAAAGVHPVHYAAVFRRSYGCSLGDYARRRRVALARRQLADRDRSLAEVAAAAGFADQSHFTRAFKRFTGVTPGHYRTLLGFKTTPGASR